jgi:hypothetical protein
MSAPKDTYLLGLARLTEMSILLRDLVKCMEDNTLAAKDAVALGACIRAQKYLEAIKDELMEGAP